MFLTITLNLGRFKVWFVSFIHDWNWCHLSLRIMWCNSSLRIKYDVISKFIHYRQLCDCIYKWKHVISLIICNKVYCFIIESKIKVIDFFIVRRLKTTNNFNMRNDMLMSILMHYVTPVWMICKLMIKVVLFTLRQTILLQCSHCSFLFYPQLLQQQRHVSMKRRETTLGICQSQHK